MANIPQTGNIYTVTGVTVNSGFPAQGTGGWTYTDTLTSNANHGTLSIDINAGATHGNYTYTASATEISEANQCFAANGVGFNPTLGTCQFVNGEWGLEVCGQITFTDTRSVADGGCGCTHTDDFCVFIAPTTDPCTLRSASAANVAVSGCAIVSNEAVNYTLSGFNGAVTYAACASQPGIDGTGSVSINSTTGAITSFTLDQTVLQNAFDGESTTITQTVCVEVNSTDPTPCPAVPVNFDVVFTIPSQGDATLTPVEPCEYSNAPIPGLDTVNFTYAPCTNQPGLSNPGGLVISATGELSYTSTNPNLGNQAFSENACIEIAPTDSNCNITFQKSVSLQFLAQSHPDGTITIDDCAFNFSVLTTGSDVTYGGALQNMSGSITYGIQDTSGNCVTSFTDASGNAFQLVGNQLSGIFDPSAYGTTYTLTMCATANNCPPQNFNIDITVPDPCTTFSVDLPQNP